MLLIIWREEKGGSLGETHTQRQREEERSVRVLGGDSEVVVTNIIEYMARALGPGTNLLFDVLNFFSYLS